MPVGKHSFEDAFGDLELRRGCESRETLACVFVFCFGQISRTLARGYVREDEKADEGDRYGNDRIDNKEPPDLSC